MEDVSLVSKPWEFGFPDQWPGDEESSTPDDGFELELPAELSAAKADAYASLSREQRLLIERARQTDGSLRGVRALMKHLPESGEELDQIFEHLVAHRDQTPFATLWAANLAEGRPADSRHFVGAINLLPHVGSLIHHIAQLRGDVAANATAMLWERHADMKASTLALLLAVLWCQEYRERQEDEPELAPRVLAHVRHLVRARLTTWREEKGALQSLYALLSIYQEPSVLEILEHHKVPVTEKDLESGAELLAELRQLSILDYLPDRLSERMVSGITVQRTAEKVGRNDSCPCGSGKKYKRCCEGQEQPFRPEDLSAPTPGTGPGPAPCAARLTKKRLFDLNPRQVYELEFQAVPQRMRGLVLARLFHEDEHQRVIEHARSLGEDMDERTLAMLFYLFHHGVLLGKSDLVRGLAEAIPKLRPAMELPFALFLGEEPGAVLEAIEADARLSILGDKPEFNVTMVTALLYSERYPALGVLLARAVIACSDSKAGKFLLPAIHRVLDLNHWNPIDRAEDLLDQVQRSEQEQSEIEEALAKAKSEASEEVESKQKEIRRLQWELKRTRNTLNARQKEAEADSEVDGLTARTVPETSTPLNGKRLREVRELRDRCARLQEELRERHSERNEMLRSLQQAQESQPHPRKDGASPVSGRRSGSDVFGTVPGLSDEDEESLLDDNGGALPNWPVRFPVWPPEVREQHKIPDSVWRAAVQLSGRLAAGDPSAIQGVKLLKGLKGIFRQRVAGSWRLMFEVTERELRIVDLVPRRDLIPWARDRASR